VTIALPQRGWLFDMMLATDRALERRPAALLADAHARDVCAGRDLRLEVERAAISDLCRAYSVAGDFLGVLRLSSADLWHPEKVVAAG